MNDVIERIRREIERALPGELDAYLRGACHDGTTGRGGTTRIGQKSLAWIELLRQAIERTGHRAWTYREGRNREFWIVETSARFHRRRCDVPFDDEYGLRSYVRGYFDAEGGIPRSLDARFYIQIGQKDRDCLNRLRTAMEVLGIQCGVLHRPSAGVDPNYWRFGVWPPASRPSVH